MFNIEVLLIGLTIIATSLLAISVYIRSPKNEVSRSYLALITVFVLWACVRLVVYLSSDLISTLAWERIAYIIGLLISWSFLWFSVSFPYKSIKLQRKLLYSGLVLTIASLIVTIMPSGLIRSAFIDDCGKAFHISLLYLSLYDLTFVLIFGYAFSILVKKYKFASGDSRVQLRAVILSTSFAVIAGLIFNLIQPFFGIFRFQIFGPSATLVFTLTVAYLLIRSRK